MHGLLSLLIRLETDLDQVTNETEENPKQRVFNDPDVLSAIANQINNISTARAMAKTNSS